MRAKELAMFTHSQDRRLRSLRVVARGVRTLLLALPLVVPMVAAIPPAALAAATQTAAASEEIMSVRPAGPWSEHRAIITSRLLLPVEATWEADPAEGPLTLRVESGALVVTLDGGSARIERTVNLFFRPEILPLSPGDAATLRAGDRLVVVRGFHLTVENDADGRAIALVTRVAAVAGA
jgi:hypothetical protein